MQTELLKYPGGEIVMKGLDDIQKNQPDTIEALAVFTSAPNLKELGFDINQRFSEPHLLLYRKLNSLFPEEAHYKYNAIMQRVNKFCRFYHSENKTD